MPDLSLARYVNWNCFSQFVIRNCPPFYMIGDIPVFVQMRRDGFYLFTNRDINNNIVDHNNRMSAPLHLSIHPFKPFDPDSGEMHVRFDPPRSVLIEAYYDKTGYIQLRRAYVVSRSPRHPFDNPRNVALLNLTDELIDLARQIVNQYKAYERELDQGTLYNGCINVFNGGNFEYKANKYKNKLKLI